MSKVNIKIFNESQNENPAYSKPGDTGCDVSASMPHTKDNFESGLGSNWEYDSENNCAIIKPSGIALIGTGIFCDIPRDYGISVRPRSGLALKKGVTVANTPGTIDSGYRNQIGVILINLSNEDFIVSEGDRIAQFVVEKVRQIEWVSVKSKDELSQTNRGQGGFGSTGK